MKLDFISCGRFSTNCYIITDEKSGESAAVDCALFNADYKRMLALAGIEKLKYLLLTHGHFDHICGAAALRESAGGEICIHAADADSLKSERASLNAFMGDDDQQLCRADILLDGGDRLLLGDSVIKVKHTPGHSKGSLCFFIENFMFCGDTLFRLSAGRTDLPGGSGAELRLSLAELCREEKNYILLPGHGERSTLDFEKENNIYLRLK